MWYAVQVRTGEEEKIKLICNKMISNNVLEECCIPYYEKKIKYMGKWHITTEILFPGYIFMVSNHINDLLLDVKKIPKLIKILGDGKEMIPLYDREIEFLMRFGKEDHLIKMSYGYIENDKIVITDGPMKDYEGTIKKIDRHKRKAIIEIEFFGRNIEVSVGVEIVRKV
ncbi:transcriptional antiterminator NusG [Clostridium tetanomorphum]|uniref:antiterminator LoaP n=1 Tax=Clostridium tetanomorphum TaxID=1553 RepID=UPI00044C13D7|nr:antiterminator LoaP [Clostridium tetanomorphum]KAJ48716.1 NusG antitermination factor [Clostridium tetanomorphum DSM 665]KAJ52102.1 NusG antitermination factor [Clostridium tetanomorphum DSM 665]MBP1863022.1 transcriptional antiterminator NusG [Clostridium tetanomorphum]NRS82851.1 transcriptional antiterminator NusG [Clostridium tetanomorphum]SQC03219.1 NusG antitermination factor [Clostridium tetanomorphum]